MLKLTSALTLGVLVASGVAQAAEPDFLITHRVATFAMTTDTATPEGGEETKTETTSVSWADPTGMEFAFFHDGWAVYAYPFSPAATLWVGKSVGPVELGPTIQYTMNNEKDGAESSGFTVGAYVFYAHDLGGLGLETNLNPYFSSSSTTDTQEAAGTEVEVDTTSSGFGIYWDLLATKKIGTNLTWAAGFELGWNSGETVAKADDTEFTTETGNTTIGLVLSEFRYGF